MSKTNPANPDPARPLPERANLEHLKKEAKQRLKAVRLDNPGVTLSAVQLTVAREHGFSSWRSLLAFLESPSDIETPISRWWPVAISSPYSREVLLGGVVVAGI